MFARLKQKIESLEKRISSLNFVMEQISDFKLSIKLSAI